MAGLDIIGKYVKRIGIVGVFWIFVQPLYAQKLVKENVRGSQYFLGSEDELLIKVNVWGFVNKPGQYMVPNGTDLISLLSFAGGPKDNAKLGSIKIVRKAENDDTERVIKVKVREYLKKGNQALVPLLRPDDTIIIKGSKWYHLNQSIEFVTKIAVLAQIYGWYVYYFNKE